MMQGLVKESVESRDGKHWRKGGRERREIEGGTVRSKRGYRKEGRMYDQSVRICMLSVFFL